MKERRVFLKREANLRQFLKAKNKFVAIFSTCPLKKSFWLEQCSNWTVSTILYIRYAIPRKSSLPYGMMKRGF